MTGNHRLSQWRGKTALVTGASSGIGAATARALAAGGVRVALAARRMERLEALRDQLRAEGAQVMALPLDVQSEASVVEVFDAVRDAWGGVDVMIANAGLGRYDSIVNGKTEDWQELIDVNVMGFMFCLRHALDEMKGNPHAQIVAVSSILAHWVLPGQPNVFYAATKHAMRAIMDGLRAEMAQTGSPIKLGMVSPGFVATEFQHNAARLAPDEKFRYRIEPLQSEDVAEAVCYLLSTPPEVQVHDIIMRPVAQLL